MVLYLFLVLSFVGMTSISAETATTEGVEAVQAQVEEQIRTVTVEAGAAQATETEAEVAE